MGQTFPHALLPRWALVGNLLQIENPAMAARDPQPLLLPGGEGGRPRADSRLERSTTRCGCGSESFDKAAIAGDLGAGDDDEHCIGHIDTGVRPERMACHEAPLVNPQCLTCGLRDHCVRWCGCTNYFSTGHYNRVGALLCASERAAIEAAYRAMRAVEDKLGPTFVEHLAGRPGLYSLDRAQWREFAERTLDTLRERLTEVKTVGFEPLMELSDAVSSVS